MAERDPRKDQKAGDKFRHKNGLIRKVLYIVSVPPGCGRVGYVITNGNSRGNDSYEASPELFNRWLKHAEVIHAAD